MSHLKCYQKNKAGTAWELFGVASYSAQHLPCTKPFPSASHSAQDNPLSGLQGHLLLRFLLIFYWHSVFVCAIIRKDKEFEKVIGPNHLLSLEGGLAKIFPLLFVDPTVNS